MSPTEELLAEAGISAKLQRAATVDFVLPDDIHDTEAFQRRLREYIAFNINAWVGPRPRNLWMVFAALKDTYAIDMKRYTSLLEAAKAEAGGCHSATRVGAGPAAARPVKNGIVTLRYTVPATRGADGPSAYSTTLGKEPRDSHHGARASCPPSTAVPNAACEQTPEPDYRHDATTPRGSGYVASETPAWRRCGVALETPSSSLRALGVLGGESSNAPSGTLPSLEPISPALVGNDPAAGIRLHGQEYVSAQAHFGSRLHRQGYVSMQADLQPARPPPQQALDLTQAQLENCSLSAARNCA